MTNLYWTASMLDQPPMTHKIKVVDDKIKQLQAVNSDPATIQMLIEYKKYLEEQLKIYTDVSCIPKTHTDTGCCIPTKKL